MGERLNKIAMLEQINCNDLDFQENEVVKQTEENFAACLNIQREAITIYSEILKILIEGINENTSKFEHYVFLQFYRNFYSVKAIHNLIKTGFYFDAMYLLRSPLESIVNIIYLKKNMQHLDSIITEPDKFAKKFSIRKRFKAIGFQDGYTDYQNLCRFSHGATLNIIAMFSASKEMDLIPYGIVYQEKNAALTFYLFIRFLGMFLDCIKSIFGRTLMKESKDLINRHDKIFDKLIDEKEKLSLHLLKFRDEYFKQYNVKI